MKQAVADIIETHGRLDAVVVAVGSILLMPKPFRILQFGEGGGRAGSSYSAVYWHLTQGHLATR